MHQYLVIYEQSNDGGWGAYVPDLPGLGIVADTREEAEVLIREGMRVHVDGLLDDGLPLPEALTFAETIDIAA